MNEDFSQRLFERIDQENVKPSPRWVVFARRSLTWVLLVLSIVCASLLGSLLLLAFFHIDLEFLRVSSLGPMLRLVLDYVPVVWALLFVLFCVLEIFLLRHETRAYRYSRMTIAGLVVVGVSLIGLGFYAARLPERIEHSLERRLPPRLQPWMMRGSPPPRPEDGVLFGQVLDVSQDLFHVQGPRNDKWEVTIKDKHINDFPFVQVGHRILIEGKFIGHGFFEAHDIRPYRGRPDASPPPPERRLQTF